MNSKKYIFIDPTYSVFDSDRLFDLTDPILNRDDQLLPFYRLRENLEKNNQAVVHTADNLLDSPNIFAGSRPDYYSLGLLDKYKQIASRDIANLVALVIMEPPVALPSIYKALPEITTFFDRVFLPNTHGDGYSLKGVNVKKLNRFYWPIPYNHVLEPFWKNRDRQKRLVVINGNHIPLSRFNEQYSMRIDAMSELSKFGVVDLYGRGWSKWWSRSSMWMPYWLNRREIKSIYRGPCISKYEVLQNYEFSLCFENMSMEGYITEKIFDCLYAGVIPLYMGSPNIYDDIPRDVFIDCRKYSSWSDLWCDVSSMSEHEINNMRDAGRDFIHGNLVNNFYRSGEYF